MRRVLASVLAVGLVGVSAAAGLAAGVGEPAPKAPEAAAKADAPKGAAVELAPKWAADGVTRYDFAFESTLDSTVIGSEEGKYSQRHYQEGRLVRRVMRVDDDGVTLSMMLERLKVEIRTPSLPGISFDSDSPASKDEGNDLAPIVRHVVGRPVTVRIDKAGNVQSIEGNEDPPPQNEDDLKQARVAQALLGDAVVKKLWRPLYGLEGAPAKAGAGETWRTEDKTPNPSIGMMILTSEYKVEGVEGTDARVGITAGLQIIAESGPGAIKPEIKSQSYRGEARWDAAAGTLAAWRTEQTLNQIQERNDVRRTVDTVVRTRLTRLAPGAVKPKDDGTKKDDAKAPAAAPSTH
jgi:hypothetical protein